MVSRKRSSALTEEKILESALKLFSEKGYASTATSQIAIEAEVSEGTIFKYFPKKLDLLRSVIIRFLEKYSAQIVLSPLEKIFEAHRNEEPKTLLKAIILERMSLFDKMGPFLRVMLTEMQYYPELRELFVGQVLVNVKTFGDQVFNELHTKGYFKELPSFLPIRSFAGTVGLMILQRKYAPELNGDGISLEEEIDQVLDMFLYGVMRRENNDEL